MDSNHNTSLFRYRQIDLSTDAIRLVRLLKGSGQDPIQCKLFETFLHQVEGVPYEALSYTWGDSPDAYEIFINDRKSLVKENLHIALLALRQTDEDRLLWIDAICIDQSNDREKGHQVGQMRLIYEHAEQVVVWLGPSNHGIDSLMDLARRWDYQTRQQPGPHHVQAWIASWIKLTAYETGPYKEELTAGRRNSLQEMLTRPWFRRVWILQEVASARRATLLCGSKVIPSRGFSLLPFILELEVDSHTQAVLDILPGYRREETWWGEKQNLETLLLKFGTSEATDHRDKIYALLGIASDARASNTLRPNYEIPLGHAICNTISFLLFQEAYDPSARQLPEDMNFTTFLRILPRLPDYIFGWALDTHNDVTATALVPKTVDINTLYDIQGSTLVPARSPLSWILSSTVAFEHTLRATLERDDANVRRGYNAPVLAVKQDRLDWFKLLVQHLSAHPSALTMRNFEILLNYAAAFGDRGIFKRIMSIVTSRNVVDLEQSIKQAIAELTSPDGANHGPKSRKQAIRELTSLDGENHDPKFVRVLEHGHGTVRRGVYAKRDGTWTGHVFTISPWLLEYLKSRAGGIKTDSFDEDIDWLFEMLTLPVRLNPFPIPENYLPMVLVIWRLKAKGTPHLFTIEELHDVFESVTSIEVPLHDITLV